MITDCKRCSECPGGPHHWMPNDEDESAGAPDYICKHCESGYAWSCIDCDEPLSAPDTRCAECTDDESEHEVDFQ